MDLILVNAETDQDIQSIPQDGSATVDLSAIGTTQLTLRVDVDPSVDRIEYQYFDPFTQQFVTQVENDPPYALAGNGSNNTDLFPSDYLAFDGFKTVTITAFFADGTVAEVSTVDIDVFD